MRLCWILTFQFIVGLQYKGHILVKILWNQELRVQLIQHSTFNFQTSFKLIDLLILTTVTQITDKYYTNIEGIMFFSNVSQRRAQPKTWHNFYFVQAQILPLKGVNINVISLKVEVIAKLLCYYNNLLQKNLISSLALHQNKDFFGNLFE